jgi:peptidoglycan/LPS O-acetylase OafA/YrhL
VSDTAPATTTRRFEYVPALDGVRGIAIAIVVSYHLFGVPHGGPVGVDLFFALSGFLITTLLLEEHRDTGRVRLGAFYLRRARRLLPALAALLATYVLWAAAHGHNALKTVAIGGLYVSNFVQAFMQPNAVLGTGLTHLWSLAQEEQFYLLWPVLLIGILRLRRPLFWTSLLLAAMLAYRTALLLNGASLPRVYLGPDTHASGLMGGAVLAMIAARHPLRVGEPTARAAVVVLGVLTATEVATTQWWLIFQPLVELSCVVIVAAAVAAPDLSHLLASRPLVALGKISYSLYLWHWPVLWALHGHPVSTLALSIALATASYRYVERPFRRRRAHRPEPLSALAPVSAA